MTEILWQLVGIWQPAHLSQISMEHPLQAGFPCWKPPWKSQPEDRLQIQWLREVSCKQAGTLQAMCTVPVLTQPSQLSRILSSVQVGVHRQWQLRQRVKVSRGPDTNVSVEGRVNGMFSIMKIRIFWSAYTASCLVKADGMLVTISCVQHQVLEQEKIESYILKTHLKVFKYLHFKSPCQPILQAGL